MDWADLFLQKSCNNTLTRNEVLHSLFHMIEVNEKTLHNIQSDNKLFGPELEEIRKSEIHDLEFHLKYYRGLVNFISTFPERQITGNYQKE